MKAVAEIIFAIILLVGGCNISKVALEAFRKESLEKVYKGLPRLEKFTRALTK
jgi:hypothetical protein